MFDFAWSEIALIGVVALIAIGPKDMPVAIKAISDTIKKLRRMAGEFQGHVDEMIREADLGDAKSAFDELRGLNPKNMLQRAIDPDGTVRSAFADPFRDHPVRPVMTRLDEPGTPIEVSTTLITPAPTTLPPAFIPPSVIPPAAIQPDPSPAPAFIPPAVTREP
jgi:sec-independent protein translocase protein TatB